MRKKKDGFSLVELSIVLVILGLVTGGILSGQSLIRASTLRSVTTEYATYRTATNSFIEQYDEAPGDMPNATSYWGKDNAACSGHSGTASVPGTCNGNGDGFLSGAAAGAAGATSEVYQFWKHLALAGLIEGSYSGRAGADHASHVILGTNVPASKLSNAGWSANRVSGSSNAEQYTLNYGNNWYFGAATTSSLTSGMILTPKEAFNIDTKLDDGYPAYGKVIARFWNNQCAAADNGSHSNTNYEASYRVADTTARCSFIFRDVF